MKCTVSWYSSFVTNEYFKYPSSAWFDFKNNWNGLAYECSVVLQLQNIVYFYGHRFAITPDITMIRGGSVNTWVDQQDQMALSFKITEGKFALRDSEYCREPGENISMEDIHGNEFKQFISLAENREESFCSRFLGFMIWVHAYNLVFACKLYWIPSNLFTYVCVIV